MARYPRIEKPGGLMEMTRQIIGARVKRHPDGEKALACLADLLAGYGVNKAHAHLAQIDLCELVEILRRDFLVPITVTTETDEDGEYKWPVYVTMRPEEIGNFINATANGRQQQVKRWEAIIKANDVAHGMQCAIELHARMGLPLDTHLVAHLTKPRRVPDINAGDSYALQNMPEAVTPTPDLDSRIDAGWAAKEAN